MEDERAELLANLNKVAKRDRKKDYWGVDQFLYPHENSIEKLTLEPLLGIHVSLQDVVDQRKATGKSTHILELFGSGAFLSRPAEADSITGIRLRDVIHSDRNPIPRPDTHVVLEHNMYDPQTLLDLKTSMRTRRIPHIDIAVCAPRKGWHDLERQYNPATLLSVYYPMLQETYSLLSSDGGILYAEIPKDIKLTEKELQYWTEQMNKRGIHTKTVYQKDGHPLFQPLLQITKMPDSPDMLLPLSGKYLLPERPTPQKRSFFNFRGNPLRWLRPPARQRV